MPIVVLFLGAGGFCLYMAITKKQKRKEALKSAGICVLLAAGVLISKL